MDVIGTWTISEMMMANGKGISWRSKEDIIADESVDEDYKETLGYRFVFLDDGTLFIAMPLPEGMGQDEIDEILASGEMELFGDDCIALEKHPWKMEGDKLMIASGSSVEILGERMPSWEEAPMDGELLRYVTYKLRKSD